MSGKMNKLVPVEPTLMMQGQGWGVLSLDIAEQVDIVAVYGAMLDAAPATPASDAEVEVERLRTALAIARREALEEAAKVALAHAPATQDWANAPLQTLARDIAIAIRARSEERA